MNIIKVLILTLSAIIIAGCAGLEHPETALAFRKFERDHGIKVNLPYTWEALRPFDITSDGGRFRCDINVVSPYPSKRSSRTELVICTSVVWDGKRFVQAPTQFNFDRFATAAVKYIGYSNYLRFDAGELEPFSYLDNIGREWNGYRRVDVVSGTNSTTGKPYTQNAIHVFFRLAQSFGVWAEYKEVVDPGIEITYPYSLGLTPLDHILNAGEQKEAKP